MSACVFVCVCVCVCVCVLNWIFFTHAKLSRFLPYRTNRHMIVNTFTACTIRHIIAVMQYRVRDFVTSTAAPQPCFLYSVSDAPISTRVYSQLQSSYLKQFLLREFPSTNTPFFCLSAHIFHLQIKPVICISI